MYVLKEHQGKNLGTWLMQCVNETLDSWPELRRTMLITSDGTKFYEKVLAMNVFEPAQSNLNIMTKSGAGSVATL